MSLFSERNRRSSSNRTEKVRTASAGEQANAANREDLLFRRIDEFRDRAKEIQKRINLKEKELNALDEDVSQREARLTELDTQMRLKQKEIEELTSKANSQIRVIADDLNDRMDRMSADVTEQITRGLQAPEDHTAQIREMTDAVSKELQQLSQNITAGLEEMEAQTEGFDETEVATLNAHFELLDQTLAQLKEDLADKTHTESVSSYRNLKSDLGELKDTVVASQTDVTPFRGTKGVAIGALIFGILNFILLGGYILYDLGILGEWLSMM